MILIKNLLDRLARLEVWLAFGAFAVMLGALIADVVGRELPELFGGGKLWATPVAVYANVFMSFIGMGLASQSAAHMRPRVFDRLAPAWADRALNRMTHLGFALFCAMFCWFSVRMTMDSHHLAETDTVMQWPIWPFQLILVLAFGLGALRHALWSLFIDIAPRHRSEDEIDEAMLKEFIAEVKS